MVFGPNKSFKAHLVLQGWGHFHARFAPAGRLHVDVLSPHLLRQGCGVRVEVLGLFQKGHIHRVIINELKVSTLHIHAFIYICICVYICVYTYIHIYRYIYRCMCVSMYLRFLDQAIGLATATVPQNLSPMYTQCNCRLNVLSASLKPHSNPHGPDTLSLRA